MSTLVQIDREPQTYKVGYKYCRSCWRKDQHESVWRMRPRVRRLVVILTLGLIKRIEPSRCVCCGTLRIF